MRTSSEPNPVESFRKIVIVGVCFVVSFAGILAAQKAEANNQPKYDVQTETKMKGTVEELKFPPEDSKKEVVHLMAKIGDDTVDIYLCPKAFLEDMGISFSKGDEIAMTGSKIKMGEADLILAREVVKGTDTLVLRDDKGNPIWNWHH